MTILGALFKYAHKLRHITCLAVCVWLSICLCQSWPCFVSNLLSSCSSAEVWVHAWHVVIFSRHHQRPHITPLGAVYTRVSKPWHQTCSVNWSSQVAIAGGGEFGGWSIKNPHGLMNLGVQHFLLTRISHSLLSEKGLYTLILSNITVGPHVHVFLMFKWDCFCIFCQHTPLPPSIPTSFLEVLKTLLNGLN